MKLVKLFVAISLCLVAAGFFSGRAYAVDTLSHAENVIGALRAADDARATLNGTPRTSSDYKNDGPWRGERDYDKQPNGKNGKAKGHYKGTPDGPPGQMDKHKDKKDKKHKNKHKD
jgi:hypothetical protein